MKHLVPCSNRKACPFHPTPPQGRDCFLFNLDDQHVLDSTEAGALCRFTVGWLGRPGWLWGDGSERGLLRHRRLRSGC